MLLILRSIDFWPEEQKVTIQAPSFDEDFSCPIVQSVEEVLVSSTRYGLADAIGIEARSMITSPAVQFYLKYSAISKFRPMDVKSNNQVFFCKVVQSHAEFSYEIRKVRSSRV